MTDKRIDRRPDVEADPLVPNAATIQAMREADQTDLPQFDSVAELLDDLRRMNEGSAASGCKCQILNKFV